jgi:hypothetical protein
MATEKLSRVRAGPVRAATVIALALVALGALAAAGAAIWRDRNLADLATARTQAQAAQTRVARANEELADIVATLPRYRALGNLVSSAADSPQVAEAARLDWIERVTGARDALGLNGFKYILDARTELAQAAEVPPAVPPPSPANPNNPAAAPDPNASGEPALPPVQVFSTRMDLEFNVLHEGEWLTALRNIAQPPKRAAPSLLHWKNCSLDRSGETRVPAAGSATTPPAELLAKCRIEWLTVQERADAAQPAAQPAAPR